MENTIERIKFLLTETESKLNNLKDENFDVSLSEINAMLAESQKHKNLLLAQYKMRDLKAFEPELTRLSKQISELFDNIIKKKRRDLDTITEKMKSVQNRKKLANYHR